MNNIAQSLLLLAVGSVLSFFAASFWYRKSVKKEAEDQQSKMMQRIVELETKSALTSAAMLPITTAFQAILIKELTHFHTPVMDALMEKLGPPFTLSEEEEAELIAALKQREADVNGRISDSERDAAHMLPMLMKRVRNEAAVMSSMVLMTTQPTLKEK